MSEGTKNDSKELTDAQLIILDDFSYLKFSEDFKGQSVRDVVNYMLSDKGLEHNQDKEKIGTIGEYPGAKTKEQWIKSLNIIKNDPALMNLKIADIYHDKAYQEDNTKNGTGARMLVFSHDLNDKKNATVIFRGTATDPEWGDNADIGRLSDTEHNKQALNWINELARNGYTNMTVSGHSKDENKAHYVGLLSEHVDRAVSFDGPGFSIEFFKKYGDVINKNKHKISKVAAQFDYVHAMYFQVVDTKYIKNTEDFKEVKNMSLYYRSDIHVELEGLVVELDR